MASPFVEIKPPEGAKISAANIVRKIKTLDGSIRMVHLSLFKHHAGAAHITSWMLYEGRLTTAHLSLSHLLIFALKFGISFMICYRSVASTLSTGIMCRSFRSLVAITGSSHQQSWIG